jgi:IS5 family transposase
LKGYLSCWFGSELVVLLAGWRKNRLNRLWRNGLETPVLRTTNPQASLWEAILPAEVLGLPAELATVDRLLDDPAFIQPFRAHFDPTRGRPSVPLDTYLRLMFLKHRYGLGYELLCREVADSISWQRFCRIPLGGRVPHPTTLVKLTRRVGEQAVDGLNQALLHRAAEHRLLRTHKVRVDTTVVAANVAYPTDLGLLTRAVDKLATTVKRVQAAGGATRTRVRDRRRAARRRAHQVARAMRSRTDQAKQVVFEVTRQVASLAEAQLADARRVVEGARRALARGRPQPTGRLRAVVEELQTTIERTRRVLDQAHTRLAGGMPDGASRLVSLHDPDARPIRKGRLGRPVEFGYKAQVVDNADGIVLDHQVMVGNPPDAPLLAPAIGRVIARTGRAPRAVAADRATAKPASTKNWSTLAWPGSRSHDGAASVPPARWSSGSVASAGWSNGAPAVRGGSAASSTASAGTAPRWTASKAPASGVAMPCSPTTSSRSAGYWKPSTARQHEYPSTRSSDHDHPSRRLIALIANSSSNSSSGASN